MVESRHLPPVHRMTRFARHRESGGSVVYYLILLEVPLVAADALCAQACVSSYRCARVTRIALDDRMSAQQWKPVPMILYGSRVHSPALNGMTALALGPELALVEIRVAIRAARAHIGKYFRDVARITGYTLMHSAKRIVRVRVVTELRLSAQRRPACGGVTILARKRNLPVRVGCRRLRDNRERYANRGH